MTLGNTRRRLGNQCGLSVSHTVCCSVCRITAELVSRFHSDVVLWSGLPVGRTS